MNDEYYKKEYEALHANGWFNGKSCLLHKKGMYKTVKETNSQTLLDYGSGKGHQYSVHNLDKYWGVVVDCYDPYVKEFSILPNKKYDGVVCTDVLEHIPEDKLDDLISTIFSKATKFVYFCVCTRAALKKFSDGSNVHVTIKTPEYWQEKISKFNKNNLTVEIKFRTK